MYKVVEYRHYTKDNVTRRVFTMLKEDANERLMFHENMQRMGAYRYTRKRTNNIIVIDIYFTDC